MEKEGKTSNEKDQVTMETAAPTTESELAQKGRLQTRSRVRAMVVLYSVLAYIIIFMIIFYNVGIAMGTSGLIPAVVVAWLFGLVPGICASLICFPANILMHTVMGLDGWETFVIKGGGIPGTLTIILCAAIVGRLRDLGLRLRNEIFVRKRAEEKLRQHREMLDRANKNLGEEISDRKRAAEELSETKKDMEDLIAISLDPIITVDSKAHITRANRAFLEMLGYSEEEVMGETAYSFSVLEEGTYESTTGELVNIGEDFLKEQSKKIAQFIGEGKISNWEAYYKSKENKIIPITQNILFLYNDKGERTASFGIIRDITEQRKAELEMIKSKEIAEEANQSKSAFLANMSHEIRTPMNGVIGFTDMLLDTGLDPEQEDNARTIKRSGEAFVSLINDILGFSKIEAGKIDIEEIDFDIEVLAYDVCELIRPRIESRNVEIFCRIGDSLPARVKSDPYRFRQVLVNLMGNAAKFTDMGEIEISIDVEEERDGQFMVHTTVKDTGIGIPEDKLDSIFELFQQADSSTTREYGGSGLGLSIGRKIARLMGGDIWAESQAGKGSTFHFTAWLKESEDRQVKRFTPVSLSGKKVLITDDNETNLEILVHIAESAGMRVVSFTGSEEALKAVRDAFKNNDPFDICILDIMMPAMSGFQLAEKIRSSVSETIPLLAFPSLTEATAKRCQKAGFNGFLPKPINRIKLLKMMERLLGEATDKEQEEGREAEIVTQHSMREDAKHSISILLAEDNPVNQKLITKMLAKAGYRVDVASNGREAVEKFAEYPGAYDIILMDVQMPDLNGIEATRILRESGFTQVPIVAMTAEAMKGDREKCLESGMNDYIPKPIKREAVFEMLKKWVIERV